MGGGGGLSTSVSSQSSEAFSLSDFQPYVYDTVEELVVAESSSVAASSLSIQASSTASDIVEMFLNRLQKYRSSAPLQKSFLSASRSIYRSAKEGFWIFSWASRVLFSTG